MTPQIHPTLTRAELYCESELDSWFSPLVQKEKCFWSKGEVTLMRRREAVFRREAKLAKAREARGEPDPWKGLDECRELFADELQPRTVDQVIPLTFSDRSAEVMYPDLHHSSACG